MICDYCGRPDEFCKRPDTTAQDRPDNPALCMRCYAGWNPNALRVEGNGRPFRRDPVTGMKLRV